MLNTHNQKKKFARGHDRTSCMTDLAVRTTPVRHSDAQWMYTGASSANNPAGGLIIFAAT